MQSLLGQFYSRIKGSQEDIASEGLTYILQRSKSARLAINKLIKSDCSLDFENLSFITQHIGDKFERPDISGIDVDGKEVLILEAKFWAALTDNQPLEYLNRLHKNSALVFICPTLRVRPVFNELLKRAKATLLKFAANQETHSIIFEQNKHVVVKTWDEILGTVKLHLVQDNDSALISDIDQIIGLCSTIDSEAFLPIQSDDLSPKYAKRINSFYDLIDKVADELKKCGSAETIGLKATPQRVGYTRYLRMNKFGVSLELRFDLWAEYADTPFWICMQDITAKGWSMTNELRKQCKTVASQLGYTIHEESDRYSPLFALFPMLDKTEDIVINDLANQIVKLTTNLER